MKNLYLIVALLGLTTFSCLPSKDIAKLSKENVKTGQEIDTIATKAIPYHNAQNQLRGRGMGILATFAAGLERAIKEYKIQYRGALDSTYYRIIPRYVTFRNNGELVIKEAQIEADYGSWGYIDGYDAGIIAGESMADRDFMTKLRVIKSMYVSKPSSKIPACFNYDTIAQLLNKKTGNEIMDQSDFSYAVDHLMVETLNYLIRNILQTGTLSWEEQEMTKAYYQSYLQQKLCAVLFESYRKLLDEHKQRSKAYPFYDYEPYYKVNLFLNLVSSWLSGIADYGLAYGKGNSEFAGSNSFAIMQEVGEMLSEKIIPYYQDFIYKSSITHHYNQTADTLQNITRKMLDNLPVETRYKTWGVFQSIPGTEIDALIAAKLKIIVSLGPLADSIRVKVDHRRKQWTVSIPKSPKLLEVYHYDHKLLSSINFFNCECDWYDVKHGRVNTKSEAVPIEAVLRKELEQRVPYAQIKNASFAKKPLKQQDLKRVIEPLLIKIFEPVVYMPHSCYSARVRYGNLPPKTIVKKPCN